MLAQRLFFGALLILGLGAIFWGDIHIASSTNELRGTSPGLSGLPNFQCGSIIPFVVLMLALCGTFEVLNLTRSAGFVPMGGVVFIGVGALNIAAWLMPAAYPDSEIGPFECELIILMLASMSIGIAQIVRRRTDRGIGDISVSIMILVYMGILTSMITALRASLPGTNGAWAVLLFIGVVKCTDISAYFTGRAIGKTKLIPAISPGKTVEGAAGGLLGGIVAAVLLWHFLPWAQPSGASPISSLQAVLFGLAVSFLGQLGDLVESVFKRDAAAKDSGSIIPAFGGILDLLDSPVFAAPVGYLLLKTWLGGG